MPLLQPILAQDLVKYFKSGEQTSLQAATTFAHAYVDNYANNCSLIIPYSLSALVETIIQIIAGVPPSPIPGTYALAIDSALVAFWAASVGFMAVPSVACVPAAPGSGAAGILASVTPAALAGTPPEGLAQLMATALDIYAHTFVVTLAAGGTSPLV